MHRYIPECYFDKWKWSITTCNNKCTIIKPVSLTCRCTGVTGASVGWRRVAEDGAGAGVDDGAGAGVDYGAGARVDDGIWLWMFHYAIVVATCWKISTHTIFQWINIH